MRITLPHESAPVASLAFDDGATVDLRKGVLRREGVVVELTTKEVALLAYLAERPGVVVSFEELHDEVWHMAASVVSRAAYFTWRRLVQKVEPDPERPANLVSHHGGGVSYRPPLLQAGPAVRAWTGALVPLLGREGILADGRSRLAEGARLLTLVGPGGAGKTRIAERFAVEGGPTWTIVDLSSATSGAEVVAALAAATGGGRVEEVLAAGPRTFVLDACEAAVEAVAERCAAWLGAFPALTLVATSRVRLRVPGEQVIHVGPLELDAAVRLFDERARAADDRYDAARHRADVLAVVQALDGLPLALELTAARVRLLPPPALRARLDGLGDRVMDATIARSWEQLEPWEQEALADLSVVRGGATLAAVKAILRLPPRVGALDALQRLLDHSLLRVDPRDPEPRYAAWAPVARFARARLAETPAAEAATLARHAGWYASLGPPAIGGHPSLRPDLPNLLLAAEAADPDVAVAAGLRAVSVLAEVGPLEEAEALARALVARAPPASEPWARLVLARIIQFGGRLPEALALAEGVVAAAGPHPPLLQAAAHLRAGTAALNLGRVELAVEHLTATVGNPAATTDVALYTSTLLLLGVARARGGAREEAARLMREALAAARAAGDTYGADTARRELARIQMRIGQARAAELALRSLRLTQPNSVLDLHLATAIFLQGRPEEAAAVLEEVVADTWRRGLVLHQIAGLLLLGQCALELDDDAALAGVCDRGALLGMEAEHPQDPIRWLQALHLARTGDRAAAATMLAGAPLVLGGDPVTAVAVHLLIAEAQARIGHPEAGRASFDAASDLARTLDLPLASIRPGWERVARLLQHPAQ